MEKEYSPSVDWQRRFGGLARLWGEQGLRSVAQSHIAVAGLGGVGSWAVEALARSGVGKLSLIDFDHVAESNINRQIQALSTTVGQAKGDALAERLQLINPNCHVNIVDDFVSSETINTIFQDAPDFILDCTDDVKAKVVMILHAKKTGIPLLVCGGAGGKTNPLSLRYGDLSLATHDALLNKIRQLLRREHGYPKVAPGKKNAKVPKLGVSVLWFEQAALLPEQWLNSSQEGPLQGLACAGYGSVVTVTAMMGMAAANLALERVRA